MPVHCAQSERPSLDAEGLGCGVSIRGKVTCGMYMYHICYCCIELSVILRTFLPTAELFKLFEPLIGKKSIQYGNGIMGRKRRQMMDRSFSHSAVQDYYVHFVHVSNLNLLKRSVSPSVCQSVSHSTVSVSG